MRPFFVEQQLAVLVEDLVAQQQVPLLHLVEVEGAPAASKVRGIVCDVERCKACRNTTA
jgi:hypothetical protein